MASLKERIVAAYRAFREPQLVTEPLDWAEFADFDSRRVRYALLWTWFENSQYRNIHSWAHAYKIEMGLYRYTRGIYNPAYRLATFWQAHLMGGLLDPAAGEGKLVGSALPIETELEGTAEERLRASVARLWRLSNWQVRKDIFTLWGTVFGDVGLAVVDDPTRKKVYLEVVNPGIVADIDLDAYGHVKGYVFEEERIDPEDPKQEKTAAYKEVCQRGSGLNVIYQTYKDGKPYQWPETVGAEWVVEYGFVPLVMVRHYDVGLDFGWSEMHAGRSKFQEVDDLASKLSDQVRKMVDAPWLFAGVTAPSSTPGMTSRDSETYQESSSATNRPQPGREEMNALYGPPEATATPLVANLNIEATVGYLASLVAEIERDYPELQADIHTASGDASGRALRVARKRAENKVLLRRGNYDEGLVRAQQMALAIGGEKGYEGFEGFNLKSYDQGLLEHRVGERPVFDEDPLDESEIAMAEWQAVNEAVKTGVPLEFYLAEEKGWDEEKVGRLVMAMEGQAYRGIDVGAWPPELRTGGEPGVGNGGSRTRLEQDSGEQVGDELAGG